jgi:hypothetical protein
LFMSSSDKYIRRKKRYSDLADFKHA